ncbi:MAG: CPBP family glutamic-type intramembrane protease [Acidobacteriaceae bacterium]
MAIEVNETSHPPHTTPRWIEWQGPRLRILPILLVFVLSQVTIAVSFAIATTILHHTAPALIPRVWPMLMIAEPCELLMALLGIALFRKWRPQADFGLRLPTGNSLIGKAIVGGITFGLIMLVVDQGAHLFRGRAPHAPASRPADIAGWLIFELFIVGFCEETLFRGFLLGLLRDLSPSRLRIGTFELSTAGYTIALIFALAHIGNFRTDPWPIALGQQFYAAALGIFYAWLLERSGSLLAPAISHNVGDFVEDALIFALARILPRG